VLHLSQEKTNIHEIAFAGHMHPWLRLKPLHCSHQAVFQAWLPVALACLCTKTEFNQSQKDWFNQSQKDWFNQSKKIGLINRKKLV
jgi:hypothetical protein